jgi:glycosyltransferase involved in cell wall biosynthesis
MRLLLLSPYVLYPPRHGTAKRIYHLARALQARHSVTVIFFDRPEAVSAATPPPGLEAIGLPLAENRPARLARWLSRFGMLRWTAASAANLATVREAIRARSVDIVVGQYPVLAPVLAASAGVPVVLMLDGIFSDLRHPSLRRRRNLYRRFQEWMEYWAWRRLERWTWRRADVLVAVSEREAEILRSRTRGKKPVIVVPNAISIEEFAEVPRAPASPPRVLFVGSTWRPNAEAVDFFVSSILPRIRAERPDLVLRVAGKVGESRELRTQAGDGIEILGFVDDMRSEYTQATCFVAPILSGHGTRVKIIEAMAAGVPVVSTGKGAEGLDLDAGREIVIADDPSEFARAVIDLVENPVLAARIGAAGRERARRDYGSECAARLLEAALERAIRDAAARRGR